MNVLIVGAGPTGLTAALKLVAKGITPEIVDAKESPSILSRAVGILPESMEHLRESGVSKRILEEGVVFEQLRINIGNTPALEVSTKDVLPSDRLPIGLPQNRTESIMSDILKEKGVFVTYNTKVADIETSSTNATVTFENGTRKTYDWVIGCDGVRSTVREKVGIEYEGYELPELWSIADIDLASEKYAKVFSAWVLRNKEHDIMVMAPIGQKRVRLVSSTPDSIKALPFELDIQNVRREGSFKISIRQASAYYKGRVLLAGDAAHAHSPVGGRGMNLGIDDAVHAVETLFTNDLHAYETERRTIATQIISSTEKIRKTLVSKNPFTRLFVRIVLFAIHTIPPIRKRALGNILSLK